MNLDEYERILADLPEKRLATLGRPPSWSLVKEGLIPFVPDRVQILSEHEQERHLTPRYRWAPQDSELVDRVAAKLADSSKEEGALNTDSEKPGLIVRLMKTLTEYYHVPECLEPWATALAGRESLGGTGLGDHLAFPHQFHEGKPINLRTDNDPLDWWLILFPQGIGYWDRFRKEPVHAMVMFVMSRPMEMVGYFLKCLKPLSYGMKAMLKQDPNGWKSVSQMNPISAARFLNQHIVGAMQGEDPSP